MFGFNKKTVVYAFCAFFVLNAIVPTQSHPMALVGIISQVLQMIAQIIGTTQQCSVVIENQGRHHAHLWCASANDKIGGNDGIWLAPGQTLGWSFHKVATTQFWCKLDWYGRQYGWDVFVANWGGTTGRWNIKNDGIYEGGGAKRMYIESNIPV